VTSGAQKDSESAKNIASNAQKNSTSAKNTTEKFFPRSDATFFADTEFSCTFKAILFASSVIFFTEICQLLPNRKNSLSKRNESTASWHSEVR
jgi:hypothetical protein